MKNLGLAKLIMPLIMACALTKAQEIKKLYLGEEVIDEIVTIEPEKFEMYYAEPEFNLKGKKVKISHGSDYYGYVSMIEASDKVKSLTENIYTLRKNNFGIASEIYMAIRNDGIGYIADPGADSSTMKEGLKLKEKRKKNGESDLEILVNNEYMQHPDETLKKKGGDCEDLSILYVSALASKGIEGALIVFQTHIMAAFKANGEVGGMINYCLKDNDGSLWIPVEMARVQKQDFMKAVEEGYNNFLKQYPCYRIIANAKYSSYSTTKFVFKQP